MSQDHNTEEGTAEDRNAAVPRLDDCVRYSMNDSFVASHLVEMGFIPVQESHPAEINQEEGAVPSQSHGSRWTGNGVIPVLEGHPVNINEPEDETSGDATPSQNFPISLNDSLVASHLVTSSIPPGINEPEDESVGAATPSQNLPISLNESLVSSHLVEMGATSVNEGDSSSIPSNIYVPEGETERADARSSRYLHRDSLNGSFVALHLVEMGVIPVREGEVSEVNELEGEKTAQEGPSTSRSTSSIEAPSASPSSSNFATPSASAAYDETGDGMPAIPHKGPWAKEHTVDRPPSPSQMHSLGSAVLTAASSTSASSFFPGAYAVGGPQATENNDRAGLSCASSSLTDPAAGSLSLVSAAPVQEEALQVAQEFGNNNEGTSATAFHTLRAGILLLLIISAIVILIMVFLVKDRGAQASAATGADASLPKFVVNLPSSTQQTIHNHPLSPQAQGYEWLIADPFLWEYDDHIKLQRFVLAVFFIATGGDEWHSNTGWLDYQIPECKWSSSASWIGVDVCHEDGTINALVRTSNNLIGTIPPELSLLKNMTYLVLGINEYLTGTIPLELWQLPTLYALSLNRNGLSGTIPTQGLLAAQNVTRYLDLANNKFIGSLPSELGTFQFLEQLGLSDNKFSGALPPELGSIGATLTYLAVNGNYLTGSVPGEMLLGLTELKELRIRRNFFTGQLPFQIGQLPNLNYLDANHNLLSGTLPSELGSLQELDILLLNNCLFNGTIPDELWHLSALTYLVIRHNDLQGTIPEDVGFTLSPAMEGFDISSNRFTGTIPSTMGLWTELEGLHVNDNQFLGSFPLEIWEIPTLRWVAVGNNLTGSIFQSLPPKLEYLNLTGSHITGTIPTEFCNGVETLEFDCHEDLCGCGCKCS